MLHDRFFGSSLWVPVATIALLALSGCGGSDDEIASSEEAIIGEVCDETDLSKPGVCEGPWEYLPKCYATGTGPECGAPIGYEQKDCYYTCALPQFGVAYYNTVSTWERTYKAWSTINQNCPYPTCASICTSNPAADCDAAGRAGRDSLNPAYGGDLTYALGWSSRQCGIAGANYSVCTIAIKDPVYNTRTDPACGTYRCDDTTRPVYPTCRHPSHGLDTNIYACGPERISYTGLAAPPTAPGDLAYAYCTTADNLSDPKEKAARLRKTLDRIGTGIYPSLNEAWLKSETVGRLKLLLEMHGEALDSGDRNFIRGLYGSLPGLGRNCGTWLAVPYGVVSPAVGGTIVMCDRLTQAHVTQPPAMASVGACVDAASSLTPTTDRETLDTYLAATQRVLVKSFERLQQTDAAQRRTALTGRLTLVQRWYEGVKGLYGDAVSGSTLWKDASAVTGAAVRGAYSTALDAFCGTPGCSALPPNLSVDAARLQTLLGSTFSADREILGVAFPGTGTAPLTGGPLAFLVANALEAESNRLSAVAPLHDVACLTQSCNESARTTAVSQTVSLFGRIHDQAALASAVTAATQVPASWKDVFSGVSAKHSVLQEALADAENIPANTPDLATVIKQRVESPPPTASLPLLTLSERVLAMKVLADRFERSRTFVTDSTSLSAGLDRDRLADIKSIVDGELSQLTGTIASYRAGRRDLALALVSEIRSERDQQSIRDRLLRLNEQTKNLANDLAALRAGQMADDLQFGSFANEYHVLLHDIPQLSDYLVDPVSIPTTTILASNSRFENPQSHQYTSITELSVGQPITVAAGDVLKLDVSNTWSPSCAVSKIGQIGVDEFKYPLSFTNAASALTGPEGYSVVYGDSSYHAFSTSVVHSNTDSTCLGITGKVDMIIWGADSTTGKAAGAVSASAQTCSSTTRSTSTSDGTEARISSTFVQGLRLSNTPFPKAPAGALVLVRMRAGDTALDARRDVMVVERQSAIVIPEDSVLYFVVNDLKDSSCSVSGGLTVNGAVLHSVGSKARALSTAMAHAITNVQSATEQYVDEGRLLPATIARIKGKATKDLETECQCRLSTYPDPIRGFFGMWVDAELSRAERRVEGANILRQQMINEMEAKSLAADLERAQHEGALIRLIPHWTLQNVDAVQLRTRAEGLSNATAGALFPFIRVLYPETFASVASNRYANNTSAAMEAILALDWTLPYDDAAYAMTQAVTALARDLERTAADTPRPASTEVAVAFVRPGAPVDPIWREADPERSAALWKDIGRSEDNPTPPRFTTIRILPEDLYAPSGGISQLTCAQSAPVIRTMGFFIASAGGNSACQTFNSVGVNVPVYFDGAPMHFPTGSGLESLVFNDVYGWLNPSVNITCGSYEYAREDPGSNTGFLNSPGYQRSDGQGLTPFDEITIDFRWFNSPPALDYDKLDASAQALVVWFKVEPRQIPTTPTSGGVKGVIGCPDPFLAPVGVTLTPDLSSPQATGTPVVFTGSGSGGTAPYQYRFFIRDVNVTTWTMVQDWSTDPAWALPTSQAAGTYRVVVHVRTGAGAFEAQAGVNYTLN